MLEAGGLPAGTHCGMASKPGFLVEVKRRNVLRACAFYAAAVWALAQGIAQH
jgi:hypothetical protein